MFTAPPTQSVAMPASAGSGGATANSEITNLLGGPQLTKAFDVFPGQGEEGLSAKPVSDVHQSNGDGDGDFSYAPTFTRLRKIGLILHVSRVC
jgi:hypothetical protein